jgi:hypothetical protein
MMGRRVSFTSSRVFLLLGIALVVIAFVAFPTRVEFGDRGELAGSEHYNVGWLFSPIIGVWGLASIALGLVQSSLPRRNVESYLLFILAVVAVGLSFAGYMAVFYGSGIVASVGRGEPFFWVYFSLVLAPSLIIMASTVKFLKAGENANFLTSKKVRAILLVTLATVPLAYSIVFLAILNLL